jgi:hypothetical protein
MDRKKELEDEYKTIFDRFHQPSGKEAKRLDEIVEEWMKIINKEYKDGKK